jgi:hypothetical protein
MHPWQRALRWSRTRRIARAGAPRTAPGRRPYSAYLCAIKVACPNRIVGYPIDSRMKSKSAVTALDSAVARRDEVAAQSAVAAGDASTTRNEAIDGEPTGHIVKVPTQVPRRQPRAQGVQGMVRHGGPRALPVGIDVRISLPRAAVLIGVSAHTLRRVYLGGPDLPRQPGIHYTSDCATPLPWPAATPPASTPPKQPGGSLSAACAGVRHLVSAESPVGSAPGVVPARRAQP